MRRRSLLFLCAWLLLVVGCGSSEWDELTRDRYDQIESPGVTYEWFKATADSACRFRSIPAEVTASLSPAMSDAAIEQIVDIAGNHCDKLPAEIGG